MAGLRWFPQSLLFHFPMFQCSDGSGSWLRSELTTNYNCSIPVTHQFSDKLKINPGSNKSATFSRQSLYLDNGLGSAIKQPNLCEENVILWRETWIRDICDIILCPVEFIFITSLEFKIKYKTTKVKYRWKTFHSINNYLSIHPLSMYSAVVLCRYQYTDDSMIWTILLRLSDT